LFFLFSFFKKMNDTLSPFPPLRPVRPLSMNFPCSFFLPELDIDERAIFSLFSLLRHRPTLCRHSPGGCRYRPPSPFFSFRQRDELTFFPRYAIESDDPPFPSPPSCGGWSFFFFPTGQRLVDILSVEMRSLVFSLFFHEWRVFSFVFRGRAYFFSRTPPMLYTSCLSFPE